MAWCVFIGDPVTAAGFRLAGAEVFTPSRGEVPQVFERLCAEARLRLIVLTAEHAAQLPPERLSEVRRGDGPLVQVIADVRGRFPAPDQAAVLRRQLGLGE